MHPAGCVSLLPPYPILFAPAGQNANAPFDAGTNEIRRMLIGRELFYGNA
jgi:hypothetical protein